jgi:hypothetical protein
MENELNINADGLDAFIPYCIYLYYLKYADDGSGGSNLTDEIIFEVFDSDYAINSPRSRISTEVAALYSDSLKGIQYENHDQLVMRRKSYVVFVIQGDFEIDDKGVFKFSGRDKHGNSIPYNHTFQNFQFFDVQIYDRDNNSATVKVAYFENHMMSASTGKALGKLEYEDFTIIPPLKGRQLLGDPGTGGTNMGPPIPPPDSLWLRSHGPTAQRAAAFHEE